VAIDGLLYQLVVVPVLAPSHRYVAIGFRVDDAVAANWVSDGLEFPF